MNKILLEKFFNDEASDAEVEEVLAWFRQQKLDPQKIQSLEELWHQIDESDFVPHDGGQILKRIHRQIKEPGAENMNKKHSSSSKISSRWQVAFPVWTKAAAILVVAGIFSFWIANNWHIDEAENGSKQTTTTTKAGETKKLTLSDGTIIRLNAASEFTFPEHFSEQKREVYLTGEAFFEVDADSTRPFIVHTDDFTTTVLGTSFNIKSYAEDADTDVSLATGKLKVEHDANNGTESHILDPGEAVVFDKKDKSLYKIRFDPEIKHGWIHGALVFRDTGLKETIKQIERWFGVSIEIENEREAASRQWKYRGVFEDESIENVLKGISYVQDFTYEIKGDSVKIVL